MKIQDLRTFPDIPIVAILRGLQPEECLDIARQLKAAGIVALEVPLNRPRALECIRLISREFGHELAIGAGTVLTAQDVEQVHKAGGTFIVSPNTDPDVIVRTKELGMESCPGFQTVSEAFTALKHGADFLKLFPSDDISTRTVKALKTVLPASTPLLCVGGITADNIPEFLAAGAHGFGIGGSLYKPGDSAEDVQQKADKLVAEVKRNMPA